MLPTPKRCPAEKSCDASNPTSAAAYVAEASYGRASLVQSFQFVAGQFQASYDDTNCLVRTEAGTRQLVDELDNAIDFRTLDRWIVVFPQNPSCGFVGWRPRACAT